MPVDSSKRAAASAPEGEAAQVLEELVQRAERSGASDIHLQSAPAPAPTQVSFRLDGVLTPALELSPQMAERVFGRIKFLARLKTYQQSLPQDGRIDKGELNLQSDLRVATYPTVTGEKIVLRLFQHGPVKTLEELHFPPPARTIIENVLHRTSGLLLLTGPAGSGKTSTIYACLSHLARPAGPHVITIEDPVEQIIPGIMQTEVNESLGLDFAKAARHLLRQDPQVLVIGEIRDEETAAIAVRAALTGHLVIATLHAGSCKGVFERLIALSADPSGVAAAVELVLNQRLLRRLCTVCSGRGCPQCLATGYQGRLPVVEWLRISDTQRQLVAARETASLTVSPTLTEHAAALLQSGLTNQGEIDRVLGAA